MQPTIMFLPLAKCSLSSRRKMAGVWSGISLMVWAAIRQ
jgi:hypothetical protein